MTTAIMERPATLPAEEIELIRRTVANGATDAELKLFLFDCQRRGVHPLDKLLHFTKRGGKYTPVTSIDFMRSQAAMSGEMAGSDDPVFVETVDERIVSATVTVYRMTQGQRYPYGATARWAEYCPDNAPMWRKMPHTMLGKCAEALALRKAFPQQLAGLYTTDEMAQADNAAPQAPSASPSAPSQAATHAEAFLRPSVPNGGDSGASIIDTSTGEERPLPPGFFQIADYSFRNGWHEFKLLRYDAQGGAIKLSTKKDIGFTVEQAAREGLPIAVTTKAKPGSVGQAYLETVRVYKAEPDAEPVTAVVDGPPITDADIPF